MCPMLEFPASCVRQYSPPHLSCKVSIAACKKLSHVPGSCFAAAGCEKCVGYDIGDNDRRADLSIIRAARKVS